MELGSESGGTRDRILDAAAREFAANGFSGAHLQRIAEQVGVQKTAVYYYYPSKEALYVAALSEMLEAFDATLERALAAPGSHAERFARMLDAVNDLLAQRSHYSQLLMRILVDRIVLRGQPLRPLVERVVGRQLAFYREAVASGAFAKLSARQLYQTVLGALVFHYATGSFGAAVLGVEDLFARSAVAWRRDEVRRLLLRAVLPGEQAPAG